MWPKSWTNAEASRTLSKWGRAGDSLEVCFLYQYLGHLFRSSVIIKRSHQPHGHTSLDVLILWRRHDPVWDLAVGSSGELAL